MTRRPLVRTATASVAALAMLVTLGGARAAAASLPALHAGADREIRDAHGRDVLLRGMNVTPLLDSYQGNPRMPTVVPLRPRDYLEMEAYGFDVIRLAVTWSKLEPQRGHINFNYIDRIATIVRRAAQHGMYTVIDMHNGGWGKSVTTRPAEKCPRGLRPAHGWFGAPAWATFTNGRTTCHKNPEQKRTPAVKAAWLNFWTNHRAPSWADGRGIQGHLVAVWGALGRRFAGNPAVAGYDLINEPDPGGVAPSRLSFYDGRFYSSSIDAIRQGEADAGGFSHMVMFEPNITWSTGGLASHSPRPGFSNDPNLVFAPHIYGRDAHTDTRPISEVGRVLKSQARRVGRRAQAYGTPLWIGEWSFSPWDTDSFKKLRTHINIQDSRRWGSAWWQWKVACGSPHSFPGLGSKPIHEPLGNLNPVWCPSGKPLKRPRGWRAIVARAYPRFSPGTLTELHARGGRFSLAGRSRCNAALRGSDPLACQLVVWIPKTHKHGTHHGHRSRRPQLMAHHMGKVHVAKLSGGWLATAIVKGGRYSLSTR